MTLLFASPSHHPKKVYISSSRRSESFSFVYLFSPRRVAKFMQIFRVPFVTKWRVYFAAEREPPKRLVHFLFDAESRSGSASSFTFSDQSYLV